MSVCTDWEIICGGRPTAADVCSRLPYFSVAASIALVALFYGSNGEPFMASLGYRPPPDSTAWYTPFTAVLAQCAVLGHRSTLTAARVPCALLARAYALCSRIPLIAPLLMARGTSLRARRCVTSHPLSHSRCARVAATSYVTSHLCVSAWMRLIFGRTSCCSC